MVKAFILQIAIAGIIVAAFPLHSAFGAADSNKAEPSVESRDEFTAQINGKELRLWKGLKLSEVFETLGDPEDMDQGNYGPMLYSWGLENTNGQSVIIEGQPNTDAITDWMIMRFEEGKVVSTLAYSTAGGSRYRLSGEIKDMREARKMGKPLCPSGLWCTVSNRTKDNREPFDILDKYDVVGPTIGITIQNGGFKTIKTSDNIFDDFFLTIREPNGKEHISKSSKIRITNPKKLNTGNILLVSIPFFAWVTDSNKPIDVPVGIYQYYGTFLGARSQTQTVEIHRQAFVVASPNSADEEIVIKPYYNKLPIHGLEYDELIKNCKATFEKKFDGNPKEVFISAYNFMQFSRGAAEGYMKQPWGFPLSDFAEVKIRKKNK